MDVEEVADELYGLSLDDFIATRTAREREAKAAGDKALASQIRSMVKPNQVGWLANQLVRQHADEIQPLLTLGSELRDATEALTPQQLQEFSRQQRLLVNGLVQKAKQLGFDRGKSISEATAQGLQETLQAALADSEAAGRLLRGRLVEGMQHVGFGPGLTANTSARRPPAAAAAQQDAAKKRSPAVDAKDRQQAQVERAQRDVERAESLAHDAIEMRDDTQAELKQAKRAVKDLEERVAKLRAKLDDAEESLTTANRDLRRLRAAFERADKLADDAARRLSRAQEARKRVASGDGG